MTITMPVPPEGLYDDVPATYWVALSMDEQKLLGSAPTLQELSEEMARQGVIDYVIDKVVPKDAILVL